MVNIVWLLMIVVGGIAGLLRDVGNTLTEAILDSAQSAVNLVLNLVGVMALWSGVMKIAEESGMADIISTVMRPIMSRLFPDIPRDHPAIAAITLSVVANLLGMGNAATPLGLRAMEKLQELNKDKTTATYPMCTFVALTLTGIVLAPTTVIAIRAQNGSARPTSIVGPIIFLTSMVMITTLTIDAILRAISKRR
ncbi:MAG TPA: hypothetical protein GX509_02810 [Firmicutes bacterium]|nr:hypothetical protein [Bacillota bacterium]